MEKKKTYTTVSVDVDTREAIKNIATFTKLPIAATVRFILAKQGFLPNDGEYNVFNNWTEETLIRYRRFLELRNDNK